MDRGDTDWRSPSPTMSLLTREDLRTEIAQLRLNLQEDIQEAQKGVKDDINQLLAQIQSLAASRPGTRGRMTPSTADLPCNDMKVSSAVEEVDGIRMAGTTPPDDMVSMPMLPGTPSHDQLSQEDSSSNNGLVDGSSRPQRPSGRMISSQKNKIRMENNKDKRKRPRKSFVTDLQHQSCRQSMLAIVNHIYFDYVVTALILLNGIMVGVQTHYMAANTLDTPPTAFEVLEVIFCIIFTTELCIRLGAYRCLFFSMNGKGWNYFDLVIVVLQLAEILMSVVAAGLGFSFNLLRILRLVRVIRLARALRLIRDLRTIVTSIAGSMKPLFWTGVLLFMVVYVLGVYITQVVLNRRLELVEDNQQVPKPLETFWGDLFSSIFSLFESITGGVDWDTVVRPLSDHISPGLAILFSFYIAFTVLAMLNVVTGVFIESVMKNATAEKELHTINHLTGLFSKLDCGKHGEITWEEFERQLETKEMREFFRTIDVDISNARSLFDLLDIDQSGSVNAEEFMDGCLRIWAPSKGLDFHMVRRDVARLGAHLKHQGSAGAFVSGAPIYQPRPASQEANCRKSMQEHAAARD